jgi:hypothetical protein
MAEQTVDGLGELTSPAANDEIGIWDVSAGQYMKIQRSTLVGATITGGGTLALGGYTLTAPATGTAALRGANNNFSALQTHAAGIGVGVADNLLSRFNPGVVRQAVEYTALENNAIINISPIDYGVVVLFNATDATIGVFVAAGSAVTALATNALFAMAPDTANKLNIYTYNGRIYLQNKRGVTVSLQTLVLL